MPEMRNGDVRGMTTIYIDQDKYNYRTFCRWRKELRRRYTAWLYRFIARGRFRVSYRRSSGGHVHYKVEGPELTEFESLLLRVHLGADWKGVVLDMKRLAVGSKQVNRAWDTRYEQGTGFKRSGPWHYWFTVSNDTRKGPR